jgi:DNA polymerase elongation subunit (family B)
MHALYIYTMYTKNNIIENIKNNVPTVITYDMVDEVMPFRRDIVDPKLRATINGCIKDKLPMWFNVTSIHEGRGYNGYKLLLFGNMPCGRKACVNITGIDIFADVQVPDSENPASFTSRLKTMFGNLQDVDVTRFEVVELFPLMGFNPHKKKYVRIHVTSLKARETIIKDLFDKKFLTANDAIGPNAYYRTVARSNGIATGSWNRFVDYTVLMRPPVQASAAYSTLKDKDNTRYYYTGCDFVFEVDIKNFKKITKEQRKKIDTSPNYAFRNAITKDNTLIMNWDIETYKPIDNGMVPMAREYDDNSERDYRIYMINSVYCWASSPSQIFDVSCVMYDCIPTDHKDAVGITIVCETEEQMIEAHTKVTSRMRPDITAAFNSSDFDWPILFDAARDYPGLERQIVMSLSCYYNTSFDIVTNSIKRGTTVKIDAQTTIVAAFIMNAAGMLDIDSKPFFMRKFPSSTAKLSQALNVYLKLSKLEVKEDLPYALQFKYCRFGDLIKDEDLEGAKSVLDYLIREYHHYVKAPIEGLDLSQELTLETAQELLRRFMAQIAYYCKIDSYRVHQLLYKNTIINDAREMADLAAVTLYDALWMANGMKVKNVFGKYCNKFSSAFREYMGKTADSDKAKYEGGYVAAPVLGLNREAPTVGLDFSSLYPSEMRSCNLSPDKIITDEDEKNRYAQLGYQFKEVGPFTYTKYGVTHTDVRGWAVKHNGVLIPNKEGAKIVDHYMKSVKYVWKNDNGETQEEIHNVRIQDQDEFGPDAIDTSSIHSARNIVPSSAVPQDHKRMVAYEPVYGRDALPGECIGIMGYVMDLLFHKRKPLKAEFVKLEKLIEHMNKSGLVEAEYNGIMTPIGDLEFMKNKVDSKQKAVKVLTNSFYGESGNFRSPLYHLFVAAGTTAAGQKDIKAIRSFCTKMSYDIHYGDTDSVYVSIPRGIITWINSEYEAALSLLNSDDKEGRLKAKLDCWTKKVSTTMREISILVEEINDYLMSYSGTTFMTMAYEEVGFPSAYLGKKKYFMVKHVETINFYPQRIEDYMVKGLDMIKQGKSGLAVKYGNEFIRSIMDPECEDNMLEHALMYIRKFKADKGSIEDYTINHRYRPTRPSYKNTFVNRIISERNGVANMLKDVGTHNEKKIAWLKGLHDAYVIPEPGEKFDTVIVGGEKQVDIRGYAKKVSIADKMMLNSVYQYRYGDDMSAIDRKYYFDKSVSSNFARFISYCPEFQPEKAYDLNKNDEYTAADKYIINKANKYLSNYYNSLDGDASGGQVTSSEYSKYKKLFKAVLDACEVEWRKRADVGFIALTTVMSNEEGKNRVAEIWNEYIDKACLYGPALITEEDVKKVTTQTRSVHHVAHLLQYPMREMELFGSTAQSRGKQIMQLQTETLADCAQYIASKLEEHEIKMAALIELLKVDIANGIKVEDINIPQNMIEEMESIWDYDIVRLAGDTIVSIISLKRMIVDRLTYKKTINKMA